MWYLLIKPQLQMHNLGWLADLGPSQGCGRDKVILKTTYMKRDFLTLYKQTQTCAHSSAVNWHQFSAIKLWTKIDNWIWPAFNDSELT